MSDDFRVTVSLGEGGTAEQLSGRLSERRVEDDVRARLGGRVSVSGQDSNVFLYTDTESAAREAEKVVQAVLSEDGFSARFALDRWHPIEEEWKDASEALPESAVAAEAEHEHLEAEETKESQETGLAEWEVRVELPSHHEAVELADQLTSEGYRPVRRWRYVIVGTNDDDDAKLLAQKIKSQHPDVSVQVELGGGLVAQMPFAVFGHVF